MAQARYFLHNSDFLPVIKITIQGYVRTLQNNDFPLDSGNRPIIKVDRVVLSY